MQIQDSNSNNNADNDIVYKIYGKDSDNNNFT